MTSHTRPKAYSYVRMSTDAQAQGDSLRRQLALSEAFAAENDLDLQRHTSFSDIGVSAYHGANRSGRLGQFLTAVKDGTVESGSYLLVESVDRLSRENVEEALALFLDIIRSGVVLVTLADRQVYRTGHTDLIQLLATLVSMSRAHEESELKSHRLCAVWARKRETAGDRPITRRCPAWLQLHDGEFQIVSGRDEVVRRIFSLAASGMGSDSIARTLNREGVRPFGRSLAWGQSYVTKILQNRAVLGEFQPHRKVRGKRIATGDFLNNYFPGIVEEELFLRVQAARRARGKWSGGRRGSSIANLFTHLAKCAYCGGPMHFVNKGRGPRGGTYLKCSTSIRGLGCDATGWRYADFEMSFLLFASQLDLAAILDSATHSSLRREISASLAANAGTVAVWERRRELAFELGDDPTVGLDYVREKLAEAEAALQAARADRVALEARLLDAAGSRASSDDLRQMIVALQGHSPEVVVKRGELAGKLREIVTSLKVATDGAMPRRFVYPQRTGKQGRRPALRDDPRFTVEFSDGVSRRVAVDRDNPLRFTVDDNEIGHEGQTLLKRRLYDLQVA